MKKTNRKKSTEESYWKTFTDLMAAILMIVLLIMMLLLLYISQTRKNDFPYYDIDNLDEYATDYNTSPKEHDYDNNNAGGGGGGGGEDEETPEFSDIPSQGRDKVAVFVTVVDEETDQVIKQRGIKFELYSEKYSGGGLQTLYTYYPKKTSYQQFETTENGTFFLPEKIPYGQYSLHNLNAPDGFSVSRDIVFEINSQHDWTYPYNLRVLMSPLKSIIRIQAEDEETKQPVSDGVYEVLAADDIVSVDGSVRYRQGDVVDEIICDENGYGESHELHLGRYTVSQKSAKQYYAVSENTLDVSVSSAEEDEIHTVECEKTQMTIKIFDEYNSEPIEGVVVKIAEKGEFTTDKDGLITVTDLEKDRKYEAKITSLPDKYKSKISDLNFDVDANGRIDDKSHAEKSESIYMTRLVVSIKDVILMRLAEGFDVVVYDANGKLLNTWMSSGQDYILEGLEPGNYTIAVASKESSKINVIISDNAKLQHASIFIWTSHDTAMVAAAVLLIFAIILIIVYINRKKRMSTNNAK
ncbi:MAG: hypothetical protein J5590_09755 [Clostridia bacterium]|nr:hypothetical protein [Clostridia bacterium]